ncbi:L-aspartate oxidase [Kamptonema cortianum]|nr:L-aspartate oxidase [Geitlerinema splendidum]MDK3156925.1 L-aspartate oxidase [Kamptonema cortianum]
MNTESCDYLVIGSGLAGLTFALHAAEHGQVTVLTKSEITESNTSWAQGGIAAAVGESDSWELHEEDTHTAGAGLCDTKAVRFLVQSAPAAIDWLRSKGANFDVAGSNELDLGREGGHSRHRIVRHADKTGWEIERVVSSAVRRHPNIQIYENTFVTQILLSGNRCVGVTAQVADFGVKLFLAKATLLATGGAGQVYHNTTNPRVATADGVAMAARIGADVRHMEFQQFHPTTLHHPQLSGFLITEAMRGAGATLRNHLGRRFMFDYDQRLELAPRDVVARSIEREIERLATWCVYLDATHLPGELLQREFPTIWQTLRTVGIEVEKDWIPVVPAQHYSCGGIVTNLSAQSSVPGLYASGECACTGVHGANRLASNSLLEAIVFSQAAAEAVREETRSHPVSSVPEEPKCIVESEAIRIRHALQRCMSHYAGVFKTTDGLHRAESEIRSLLQDYESAAEAPFSAYVLETRNLLDVALIIVEAALSRKQNIGLHHNADLAPHST